MCEQKTTSETKARYKDNKLFFLHTLYFEHKVFGIGCRTFIV